MVTLQTWQEQMSEDMRLRDFRPRTQEGYLLATRQFMDWAQRAPSRLSDEHVRAYFLYLREDKSLCLVRAGEHPIKAWGRCWAGPCARRARWPAPARGA